MNRDVIVGFAYTDEDVGAAVPVRAWTFEDVNAARMALEELTCYDLELSDIRWIMCAAREAPKPVLLEEVAENADCWDDEDEDEDEGERSGSDTIAATAKREVKQALKDLVVRANNRQETFEELDAIAGGYYGHQFTGDEREQVMTELSIVAMSADVEDVAVEKIFKLMRPDPWPFPKG
jgi:hypothetical protein